MSNGVPIFILGARIDELGIVEEMEGRGLYSNLHTITSEESEWRHLTS